MATSTFGYPITYPKFKAFHPGTGTPLSGGLLKTYLAGTSTPAPTYPSYVDAINGTNPNSIPIELDTSGEAVVFGQGGVAYKLNLTDSVGNLLWSFEPVVLTDIPKTQTSVSKNGNQGLAPGFNKIITWNVEVDSLNEWSAANNRWTATYAGKYLVLLQCHMQDSAASRQLAGYIYKNGGVVAMALQTTYLATFSMTVNCQYTWIAAAGDYIECFAQGIGASTSQVNSGNGTRLTILGIE